MSSDYPLSFPSVEGVSFDVDGVVVHPECDLARNFYGILDPEHGDERFREVSDEVLREVERGNCPYGYTLEVMAGCLEGVPYDVLKEVGEKADLFPGAPEAISSLQSYYQDSLILATAAYGPTVDAISERLKYNGSEIPYLATDLVVDQEGFLTGGVEVFNGGVAKRDRIMDYYSGMGLEPGEVLHIGDSWTDIDSFEFFNSIAINPKYQEVFMAADLALFTQDMRNVPSLLFEETLYDDRSVVVNVSECVEDGEVEQYCCMGRNMRDELPPIGGFQSIQPVTRIDMADINPRELVQESIGQ